MAEPGDRAEEHAGEDVDEGQPASEAAHQDVGEIDQPAGDPAVAHEQSGEDEERNRQQREAVDAGGDVVRRPPRKPARPSPKRPAWSRSPCRRRRGR